MLLNLLLKFLAVLWDYVGVEGAEGDKDAGGTHTSPLNLAELG